MDISFLSVPDGGSNGTASAAASSAAATAASSAATSAAACNDVVLRGPAQSICLFYPEFNTDGMGSRLAVGLKGLAADGNPGASFLGIIINF